ncbi:MAG: hypothetical protein U0165_16945 [Polyangiaceae bacterium]
MKKATFALLGALMLFGNGCVAKYSHAVSASTGSGGQAIDGEASGVGTFT